MNKYKIIFKYLDGTAIGGYKYIKANSKKDAMFKFNELYKTYKVEIKKIELMEVQNETQK